MSKCSTEKKKVYVGFDVSEESIEIFAILGEKTSKGNIKIENSQLAIKKFLVQFKNPSRVCVVMETGTHSAWMSDMIQKLGFEVIVAHSRDLALIYGTSRKNDRADAEKLARLAQADKKLLHPIEHMTMERQKDLQVLKARDLLVRQRTQLINTIRGFMRSAGYKLVEKEYTANQIKKCCEHLPEEMKPAIFPLAQQICYLDSAIKEYNRQIKKICKKYPATRILQQIAGVGDLTSLAFALIVGNPERFENSARLCAYFGLVPKQDQSGNTDKQLGITKKGNCLGRKLLIQASNYIMGPLGPDCELRTYGLRIRARGGKIAKKKSLVAVARKLVTVLLALWKNPDNIYDPNFKKNKRKKHVA